MDNVYHGPYERELINLLKNDVSMLFGPGTYIVEVRTDADPNGITWLVIVAWFKKDKACTGTITPHQAKDAWCRKKLATELRKEAYKQGLLEFRPHNWRK